MLGLSIRIVLSPNEKLSPRDHRASLLPLFLNDPDKINFQKVHKNCLNHLAGRMLKPLARGGHRKEKGVEEPSSAQSLCFLFFLFYLMIFMILLILFCFSRGETDSRKMTSSRSNDLAELVSRIRIHRDYPETSQ